MGEIIQFPPKKSIEDIFMESLSDEQNEMFYEIISKIRTEYEEMQNKLVKKIAECEMLRLENKSLKGEKDENKRFDNR